MTKAVLAYEEKKLYPDGCILQIRIWVVDDPVPPATHRLKYACFYGRLGERVVLYDNERGKGDHRHYGAHEEPYAFTTFDALIADFTSDVLRARGGDA